MFKYQYNNDCTILKRRMYDARQFLIGRSTMVRGLVAKSRRYCLFTTIIILYCFYYDYYLNNCYHRRHAILLLRLLIDNASHWTFFKILSICMHVNTLSAKIAHSQETNVNALILREHNVLCIKHISY